GGLVRTVAALGLGVRLAARVRSLVRLAAGLLGFGAGVVLPAVGAAALLAAGGGRGVRRLVVEDLALEADDGDDLVVGEDAVPGRHDAVALRAGDVLAARAVGVAVRRALRERAVVH